MTLFVSLHRQDIFKYMLDCAQFTKLYIAFLYLFDGRFKRQLIVALYFLGLAACFVLGWQQMPVQYESLALVGIFSLYVLSSLAHVKSLPDIDAAAVSNFLVLCILSTIFRLLSQENEVPHIFDFVLAGVVILSFCFLIYIDQSDKVKKKPERLNLFPATVIIVMFFVIMSVAYSNTYKELRNLQRFHAAEIFTVIVFLILDAVLVNRQIRIQRLFYETEQEKQIIQADRNYYESLLARETTTRKFRHDLRDHMITISALVHAKEYDELSRYIDDLTQGAELNRHLTDTGNDIVNALISDLSSRFPSVNMKWTGVIPANLRIRQMDLVIIMSNLLKNAFEAASIALIHDVETTFRFAGSTLFITVTNNTAHAVKIVNDNYIPQTDPSGEHGLGLENVREAVKRYHGKLLLTFTSDNEGSVFTAEVFIPNAI